jgi:transposase
VRAIGLDVHRDFCEVAVVENGVVGSAGRVASTPAALELLAASLSATDKVALEVTGNAWEIARILEPHVARVLVVSPADTGIAGARAKTDRLDARTLAKLLWAGELDAVWTPDERCRVMRRRLSRREQLVRARSRAKNEIHAVLVRRLVGKPPMSDLFGVKGREWLRSLELAVEECETVEGCMRHVEFLDSEIAAVERQIAREALGSKEIRQLMTVPGVNVIAAAEFMAAIGDIRRKLRPVGSNHPDARQPLLRAQRKHLAEETGNRVLVTLDEPRDRRVIRSLLRRQHPERDVLLTATLDLPRRPRPARIGVEQQRHHHRRVIGRPAAAVLPIGRIENVEVHLADGVDDKPGEVVLRQPVPDVGWHQKRLRTITRDKALGHHEMVLNPPDDTATYATASGERSSRGGRLQGLPSPPATCHLARTADSSAKWAANAGSSMQVRTATRSTSWMSASSRMAPAARSL